MAPKFDNMHNNLSLLGLIGKSAETIEQYKDIITNKCLLTEHFNIMRLLKNDDFLKENVRKKGNVTKLNY